jgi:hypothetical protein
MIGNLSEELAVSVFTVFSDVHFSVTIVKWKQDPGSLVINLPINTVSYPVRL